MEAPDGFVGHVMKNNAKMAVALRAVFPSNFVNGQYIGLQQSGKMRGSIINSAPAVYSIFCGEKPVNAQDLRYARLQVYCYNQK